MAPHDIADSGPIKAVADRVPNPPDLGDKGSLKHLNFVVDVASTASAKADAVYKQARPYTPSFAEPYVAKVEDTVSAYTAPVVASAADVGEKLLARADEQVDYVAKNLSTTSLKENYNTGVKHFTSATQKYFDALHDLSSWLADKLSPAKNVTRAKEQLHAAIVAADKATDPDAAVAKVQQAWGSFAGIPAVSKLLSTFEPLTKYGQSTFIKSHDTLVGSPLYKSVFDLSFSTLKWATTTTPYKLSGAYLYPWVEPVATPAIGKVTSSKTINEVANYWKPASA